MSGGAFATGITASTNSVVFGTTSAASTYSCTCPAGTGVITAIAAGTNLPAAKNSVSAPTSTTTVTYGVTAGTASVASTVTYTAGSTISGAANTLVQAYIPQLCTDLLPGYALSQTASAVIATQVVSTGCTSTKYCPGLAGLFSGSAVSNDGVTFTTNENDFLIISSTNFGAALATLATAPASNADFRLALSFPGVCGSGLTPLSSAPYVACQSAVGYYLAGNVATTTSATATGTACTGSGQTPALSFICPKGTYGTGLTVASTVGEIVCQANSVSDAGGTTCTAAAGYYGANDATGTTVVYTACPTGTTTSSGTTTAQTTVAGCTDLKAGYALNPGVTSSTWSQLVYTCSRSNYGCGGYANLFISSPTLTNTGVSQTGSLAFTSATALTGTMTTATANSGTADLILGTCPNGVVVGVSGVVPQWTSANSLIADCTDLAVGWAFNPSLAATTNLTALLTQCSAGNYGCAGAAGVFVSSITTSTVNSVASSFGTTGLVVATTSSTVLTSATAITTGFATNAANVGANIKGTCPVFATNTFTATSSPTWSATGAAAVSDCTDLVPGYAFFPSVADGNQDATVLLDPCTAGTYSPLCAGSAKLFTSNPPVLATTVTTGLSAYAAGDLVLLLPALTGNVFGAFGTTTNALAPNSPVLLNTCPTGSTNAGGAAMTSISSCIVKPGYYIDPSNLNAPAPCPTNEYCLGGGAVGTAGGDTVCPVGSVGPASSPANSALADCVVLPNYYINTTSLNTPVHCPTASVCAGGGPVGTAGGSAPCSPGSTIAACITPAAANASTTMNGAPVTVSPAAVTVSPAAVTVTPAPITVNFTHSPTFASAAPRAAAHAAVLALAALAALVAF